MASGLKLAPIGPPSASIDRPPIRTSAVVGVVIAPVWTLPLASNSSGPRVVVIAPMVMPVPAAIVADARASVVPVVTDPPATRISRYSAPAALLGLTVPARTFAS